MSSSATGFDGTPYRETLIALKRELPDVPRHDLPSFFSCAASLSVELPEQLRQHVSRFQSHGNDDGFLSITGWPLDEDTLPATPDCTPAPVDRPLLDMEAWIALISAALGKATGYRENRAGSVLQDVYPIRDAHVLTANNYQTELRYHTEMAYHVEQPDYLVIGCSRADHAHVARTLIASVRKVARQLDEDHRRLLRSVPLPWHVDLAFRGGTDPDPVTHLLLLTEDDDVLRYDRALIRPSEAGQAREALLAFSAAVDHLASSIRLRPGDIIIVDNYRTAHARTPFAPQFDGTDRWLNRIFVRSQNDSQHPHAEIVPFQLREADPG
ncbi:TauD/TfdA family dioxygenase [Paraburkholderia lacunae]|uniref:Clavaminate synthase n=1 Tax=Paraburkholderia lacunae TaxID=2211104 RepID=A0A370MW03_9BURK|nr:TauD/TfdA family dioxygenase [Paraburkholderia lacunae]RDJ97512.1 clavaminate synthase [Paraburkholderia lacunae]